MNVLNILKVYDVLIWRKGRDHRGTRPIRGPVPPYPLGPPIGPPTAGPRKGYGIMHAHRICSPQDTATIHHDARMRNSGYVWTVYRHTRSNVPKTGHCQDRHVGTCIHYRYGLHPGRHDTSSMWMCHANPANGHGIAMYRNGYMVIHNVPTASWRG